MTTHFKKGDKIKGEKIYCEARKVNPLKPALKPEDIRFKD